MRSVSLQSSMNGTHTIIIHRAISSYNNDDDLFEQFSFICHIIIPLAVSNFFRFSPMIGHLLERRRRTSEQMRWENRRCGPHFFLFFSLLLLCISTLYLTQINANISAMVIMSRIFVRKNNNNNYAR